MFVTFLINLNHHYFPKFIIFTPTNFGYHRRHSFISPTLIIAICTSIGGVGLAITNYEFLEYFLEADAFAFYAAAFIQIVFKFFLSIFSIQSHRWSKYILISQEFKLAQVSDSLIAKLFSWASVESKY